MGFATFTGPHREPATGELDADDAYSQLAAFGSGQRPLLVAAVLATFPVGRKLRFVTPQQSRVAVTADCIPGSRLLFESVRRRRIGI
jgi:hypothetical protein